MNSSDRIGDSINHPEVLAKQTNPTSEAQEPKKHWCWNCRKRITPVLRRLGKDHEEWQCPECTAPILRGRNK